MSAHYLPAVLKTLLEMTIRTKEVVAGNTAVLEFERTSGGKYINGVDIITCDDDGKIIEFKVMIRPLQAINMMHAQMKAMLDKMKG